jgi:Nif-specific regulatory protein
LSLAGVFDGAEVDAGAILLLPRTVIGEASGVDLEVLASRSDTEFPYHRVSNFLASTVLREGEAVLARNVLGDSALGGRDSKGEIHATSVLCAPIRRGTRISGLIHLYSTDPERIPDPDDLEFTLAVADTVAVALENLSRRQELAENLSQIRDENLQLRERLGVESEIVGNSPVMARVGREISRAAPSRATVLIRGESGVGKELVARAVRGERDHLCASIARRSPRAFWRANCLATSEARSPAPPSGRSANSRPPTPARSCSTRSAR